MKYPELFIEVLSGDLIEIQRQDGSFIASLCGESLGLARVMAASPDLLAYAECEEAWEQYVHRGATIDSLRDVFDRHGHQPGVSRLEYLALLRRKALEKVR